MTGTDDGRLNPIPDPDSPAGQLAQALRELARAAGFESLRELARSAPAAPATVSAALSGRPNQVPTTVVIKAICKACNADEPTLTRLLDMRAEAIKARPPGTAPVNPAPPDPAPVNPPPRDPASLNSAPPEDLPRRPPSWRQLPVLLLVALVGLVAVGVVGWKLWPDKCGWAFSGGRLNDKVDGECIGITDGGYLFNNPSTATNDSDRTIMERINDMERRIEAENNAVASSGQYVKVVLLAPMTTSHDKNTLSVTTLEEILRSLEGSYSALYRANHSSSFGDLNVKLQLLLASQGSQQNADPDFLNLILKASEPSHPVVAVTGLGSSLPSLKTTAEYLADHGIPMVSAVASADNLTALPLLWSVSPSNSEYVNRIHSFLQSNEEKDTLKSGIIVYDLNPDYYTQTLAQDYHSDDLKPYVKFPDQGFRGATQRGSAQPDVFVPIVTNLCNAANDRRTPLNMVFYAGRSVDLKAFAEALATRTCKNQALTVLVATSAFPSVLESVQQVIRGIDVKVVVATSADPAAPGYPDFLKAYQTLGFKEEDIDGYTIEHHDALATAAKAIRLAAQGRPTQLPTAQDVTVQLGNLNLSYAVPGASGTLSFQPQGGRATRPPGQSIPIKQIG